MIQHLQQKLLKGKSLSHENCCRFEDPNTISLFQGRVEVKACQENMKFENGPFSYFGVMALGQYNLSGQLKPFPSPNCWFLGTNLQVRTWSSFRIVADLQMTDRRSPWRKWQFWRVDSMTSYPCWAPTHLPQAWSASLWQFPKPELATMSVKKGPCTFGWTFLEEEHPAFWCTIWSSGCLLRRQASWEKGKLVWSFLHLQKFLK